MPRHVLIDTPGGRVHARVHLPEGARACVVFSHGFTGNGHEAHRLFLTVARRLPVLGIGAVLFDYRGSGYSDLDFEQMTMQTEQEDLHAVLDFVRARTRRPVITWGLSLGASVAALVAEERDDVAGLVAWCPSLDLHRRWSARHAHWLARAEGERREDGYVVTRSLIESMQGLDVEAALVDRRAPTLLVAGDEDGITPIEHLRPLLSGRAHGPLEAIVVAGGTHGLIGQPRAQARAVEYSLAWIDALASNTR